MSTQARVPTKINVIVIINNAELKNQLIYNMDFPTVLATRVSKTYYFHTVCCLCLCLLHDTTTG